MGCTHIVLLTLFLLESNLLVETISTGVSLSLVDMENLLQTEKLLIGQMESYAEALEKKVNLIKRNVFRLKEENEKALQDAEGYLSNPLAAFSLVRRTENDWTHWELFMKKQIGTEFIDEITKLRSSLSTSEDLEEAVRGIYRLQDTYNLSPEDMASGKLNGKQYNVTFSAVDCFAIGFQLFKTKEYSSASLWLNLSLTHYEDNDAYTILDFKVTTVWYFYALTNMELGNYKEAVIAAYRGLQVELQNAEMIRLKKALEIKISQEKILQSQLNETLKEKSYGQREYERGCRGEYPTESNLVCRYNKSTIPFLKLAPVKMEEVHTDPYMVLFHDVISETEIAGLKTIAKPKLKRANIYDYNKSAIVSANTRTGKVAWLHDNESALTTRINQRISDMTGFDLRGSEQLQIANYGLGGHFDTHYDSFNVSMDQPIVKLHGDRIATVMFYLSDVEQGGATVFPNIKRAIKPRKGSALLWYNLNLRGELNYKTLHAACPVLVGSKWVCNKWIREKAQTFIKRCF